MKIRPTTQHGCDHSVYLYTNYIYSQIESRCTYGARIGVFRYILLCYKPKHPKVIKSPPSLDSRTLVPHDDVWSAHWLSERDQNAVPLWDSVMMLSFG